MKKKRMLAMLLCLTLLLGIGSTWAMAEPTESSILTGTPGAWLPITEVAAVPSETQDFGQLIEVVNNTDQTLDLYDYEIAVTTSRDPHLDTALSAAKLRGGFYLAKEKNVYVLAAGEIAVLRVIHEEAQKTYTEENVRQIVADTEGAASIPAATRIVPIDTTDSEIGFGEFPFIRRDGVCYAMVNKRGKHAEHLDSDPDCGIFARIYGQMGLGRSQIYGDAPNSGFAKWQSDLTATSGSKDDNRNMTFGVLAGQQISIFANTLIQSGNIGHAMDNLIDTIGNVSLTSEALILEVRTAFDALTDEQKALVTKEEVLKAAEKQLVDLKDKTTAEAVDNLIDAIGTVTLESEKAITDARAAYEALTDAQKALVTKEEVLKAAEKQLSDLKDKAAAKAVDDLIDSIGTVTLQSEKAIADARAAYEALTDAQKALVEKLSDLIAAEESYDNLVPTITMTITAGAWLPITEVAAVPSETQDFGQLIEVVNNTNKKLDLYNYEIAFTISRDPHLLTALGPEKLRGGFYLANEKGTQVLEPGEVAVLWIVFNDSQKTYTADDVRQIVSAAQDASPIPADTRIVRIDSTNPEVGFGEYPYVRRDGVCYAMVNKRDGHVNPEDDDDDCGTFVRIYGQVGQGHSQLYGDNPNAVMPGHKKFLSDLTATSGGDNPVNDNRGMTFGTLCAQQMAAYITTLSQNNESFLPMVDTAIEALGEITLESEAAVTDVRTLYNILSETQKAGITKADVLVAAETRLAELKKEQEDKEAAKAVDDLIDAIGTVTLESEKAITDARTAYDALTDDQKPLVTKLETLTTAESTFAQLKEQADKAAAKAVDDLIDAIGTVTLESEKAIADARTAYDALTDDQKPLVTKLETLTTAEAAFAQLKEQADKAAAKAVDDLIDAIGTVTLESEKAITDARTAYDALTDAQKNFVEKLEVLTAAEKRLQELIDDQNKIVYGDVNGDGTIDAIDALIVLKASVGKQTLNETETKTADVDGNGKLDAVDALWILKKSVKKVDRFPVEESL